MYSFSPNEFDFQNGSTAFVRATNETVAAVF